MKILTATPESQSEAPATRSFKSPETTQRLPAWLVALAGLVIFGLALAPRLIGLEQHLTADDQDWVRRVTRFSLAVQRGSWRETYQSSHPGVPVLWLASLAIGPQRATELAVSAGSLPQLEKSPAYLGALFDARRALALVSALLTVVLAFLTWRLFGLGPGLLAGFLMASEPFLVAHGRLLHTDALLAQLMAASMLAALLSLSGKWGLRHTQDERGSGKWAGWTILSGVLAGLALLTKAPGIFLLGFVPLLALFWHGRASRLAGRTFALSELRPLAFALAVWGLAAGGVCLLLWPALWEEPLGTLGRLAQAVRGVGESPRRWGNFFFGQAVEEDVGPLFYPVSLLLRLSPITLAGLLLLGWFGQRRSNEARAAGAARRGASWRIRVAVVAAYVVLFAAMMSLSPKKVDRYLLPIYPALAVLAGVGLWLGLRYWLRPKLRWGAVLAVGLAQAALVAGVQPYPLSFYDPLLGGIRLARQTVIVGWGEGTDQVAAYLDQLPNSKDVVVTSLYHDLLHAQFRGTGVPLWEWQRAHYLADYVNMDQRNLVPPPLQPLVREQPPVFVARVNGLEYARLYRIPPGLKLEPGPNGSRGTRVPRP